MKQQFIVEYCLPDKFQVYGPDGTELQGEARLDVLDGAAATLGNLPDGHTCFPWRECRCTDPTFGELDAMGAFVAVGGTPVFTMGDPDRRVLDIRRLDVLDKLIELHEDIADKPWFLDNVMPTFRPGLHGGVAWIDEGSYAVAVLRVFEHIRKRFPAKPLLWNGVSYGYPEYLVDQLMSVANMTLMEKPTLSWTEPLNDTELASLDRKMQTVNRYGGRLAVVFAPTSDPGTDGWQKECRGAMALMTIASPDSPFSIQTNYSSLHLVDVPWGELGDPEGPMEHEGSRYARRFAGGSLAVDVAKGELECGRRFNLWT